MTESRHYTRSIAIFAAREDATEIMESITACRLSSAHEQCDAICDVLVNGNRKLADDLLKILPSAQNEASPFLIRLWYIDVPDKAHTWNVYFEHIWPEVDVCFFADGYVQPWKASFLHLSRALTDSPEAVASSAIPTIGFFANKQSRFQIRNRGINGNLFALNKDVISRLRESGFRLPRGLYRTDPLIQMAIKFDFKPSEQPHNPNRVVVVESASYERGALSLFKWADLKKQFNRYLRQRQGDIESMALRRLFRTRGFKVTDLQETVRELLINWAESSKCEWRMAVLRNPLRLLALRRVSSMQDMTVGSEQPELAATVGWQDGTHAN